MSMKLTIKTFFNSYSHYDEKDRQIGISNANPLFDKEYIHRNMSKIVCGYSKPDFGGGYIHYDANMKCVGKSVRNPLGGYVHYLADGDVAGTSTPDIVGNLIHHDLKINMF